jgi:hypothetical protein
MKVKDIFTTPIIHCTTYQSVDVSKFLNAVDSNKHHAWTFTDTDGQWVSTQHGLFKTAARKAVSAYCYAYLTKYARLILINMKKS